MKKISRVMKSKNRFLKLINRFFMTVSPEKLPRFSRNKTRHRRGIAKKSGEMTSVSPEKTSMT
jgi:hypothetical protein